jgi:hypothetical protein
MVKPFEGLHADPRDALNAKKGLDIPILHGDLFEPADRRFDVILFNPGLRPGARADVAISGGRILLRVNSFCPLARVIGVAENLDFQA